MHITELPGKSCIWDKLTKLCDTHTIAFQVASLYAPLTSTTSTRHRLKMTLLLCVQTASLRRRKNLTY